MHCRSTLAAVLVSVLSLVTTARAAPIVINFDSVDTSAGPAVGAPAHSYLAGFGITFTSSFAVNPIIEPGQPWITPSSSPNMFGAIGLATAFSYTLSFANQLESLSFTRPGFNPAIMSAWTATAFSASNAVLATAGEPSLLFNASPATFTLTGPGIDHVVFTDNAFSFAGINFRMDNLTLTPVPEPATMALFLAGVLGLGALRRRRSR